MISPVAPPGVNQYRPDIDGLRGIAILAVVGYHAYPQIISGGFVGVDVFFIISGYLITGIIINALQQQSFSFVDFYVHRIRRIFPALLVVLFSCILAGWFLLLTDDYKYLAKHTALSTLFLSNFALWGEAGYFDATVELKPLLHLWSLSIEEQFYLAWPLMLFLFAKLQRGLPILVSIAFMVSLTLNLGLTEKHPIASFFLPHTRFWEPLLGGLLALMVREPTGVRHGSVPECLISWFMQHPGRTGVHLKSLAACLGLSMIAAAAILYTRDGLYPGWSAMIPAVGTFLVISAGASSWVNRNFLGNRLLVFIGLISYPLYLWHWPLLAFARIVGESRPSWSVTLVLVGVAIVLAWLTYRFVEKPIRFPKSKTYNRRTPIILILAMLGTGLLAETIFSLKGLPGRFPKVAQYLTDYKFDYATAYRESVCFIEKIEQLDRAMKFSPLCVDEPLDKSSTTPLLVLWGDSMAAHLYPGLGAKRKNYKFRIAQFTVALCPPILGYRSNPLCAKINDSSAARIKSIAPNYVILAAYAWVSDDLPQLLETVRFLRASGVKKIIFAGPMPRWGDALPKLLYRQFSSDSLHRIPQRMTSGLYDSNEKLDAQWREMAEKLSVDYVSFMSALCNTEGCLTRVGDKPDELTAWDSIHLTSAGSVFLVDRIFPTLFSKMPERIVHSTAADGMPFSVQPHNATD